MCPFFMLRRLPTDDVLQRLPTADDLRRLPKTIQLISITMVPS